jgi:hypothetical protein
MKIIKKLTKKIGLHKPIYSHIVGKITDYLSFKSLAAQQKMTHVDSLHDLIATYVDCKKKKHEVIIADLLRKQDALVDKLKLYYKRVGEIHTSPAANTSKSSSNGDLR